MSYTIPAEMPASVRGRVVQIDDHNVTPVRFAGLDKNGIPREESICPLSRVEKFVDRNGNICDVPLACSRTTNRTPEGEKYATLTRQDQLTAGSLPLSECPFTLEYKRLMGGTLVPPSEEGDVDCGGAPDGCSHMKRLIKDRRKASYERWKADQGPGEKVSLEAAVDIARAAGEGIGAKLSVPSSKSAARANLIAGKDTD